MRTPRWIIVPVALIALASTAWAADKEAIQQAIDRGVTALKALQQPNGSWQHNESGATSLAALTLLECGAKGDDPALQKAAAYVREASIAMTQTYSLSLAIMFLDRLGEPADVPLIESMAVRLLAGQNAQGSWSYNCPPLAENELRRLQHLLKNRNELVAGKDIPKPGQRREVKDLSKEIQAQLDQIRRNEAQGGGVIGAFGDNSNTQFATLALWVARRNGIPVERALARVEARFRASQNPDGGWSYTPMPAPIAPLPVPGAGLAMGGSTPAMTCAGLLGLGAGYGSANEAAMKKDPNNPAPAVKDPNKDPVVRAGLIALGTAIGNPAGNRPMNQPGGLVVGGGVVGPGGVAGGGVVQINIPILDARQNAQGYYFLWSMERVAVAYGLETIGNKDWYQWGSDILLKNQMPDGSWQGEYSTGGVDTCFALLFLRRANLAQDLTATLKGKIQDPEARELKAGGGGGAELAKGVGLKPAFDNSDKAPTKTSPTENKDKPAVSDNEAAKLAEELLSATGKQQDEALYKLRDSKGAVYTQALTTAIPKLTGMMKTRARDALAERLTRMTPTTLKDKLQDDDLEVRRAAALATAMKDERPLIPRLIEMLQDPEAPVARAAQAALKNMTNQDFGPDPDASRADRDKAVAEWKKWWVKQGMK